MGNLAISIKNLSILNSEIYFQKPSIVNKNIFKEQGEKLETAKIMSEMLTEILLYPYNPILFCYCKNIINVLS